MQLASLKNWEIKLHVFSIRERERERERIESETMGFQKRKMGKQSCSPLTWDRLLNSQGN
jgi:hypothetical protein